MSDSAPSFGQLCARLARQHAIALREALVPLGLLPAQFTALAEIAAAEGLTQKQLVARLDLEQPGVARTLAGLEAMGWIEARSGRSPGLRLSARARAALPRALALAEALDRRTLAALTRTERAHLLDTLATLAEGRG